MISESNQKAIKERFEELKNPVVIQYVESSLECQTCQEVRQLYEELTALSDLLTLEVYNLYADEDKVKEMGVNKVPAAMISDDSKKDYGVWFYGAPSGYEFATLLEDILMLSRGDSGLQEETKKQLSGLTSALDLSVFVTPTCPYCPAAVHLAHQFAFESGMVHANMVEAQEFPDWASEFNVYGVPKTIINNSEANSLEGAAPENMLLEKIMEVVASS
ncbi:thioredoxin family protein [Alicyclobacillus sp. SO9]|nr:thioredoxin family protein [Alicyclobacillus sp. SO9]